MKKLAGILTLAIMLWACTNESIVDFDITNKNDVISKIRTPNEAVSIAEQAYSNFFRTTSRSAISANKNVIALSSHSFSNSRGGDDTVLYIVNFENNKGFAIVNALKNGKELLGI